MRTHLIFAALIVLLFTSQNGFAQSHAKHSNNPADSSLHFENYMKKSEKANISGDRNWLFRGYLKTLVLNDQVFLRHLVLDSKAGMFRTDLNASESKCYEIRKPLTKNYQFLFNFMSRQEYMIHGF